MNLSHFARIVLSDLRCASPKLVDLELTNRCNLRCRMCWFHGESGIGDRYQGRELATEEVFALVDQLARYDRRIHLYLGGAEPLMREDFSSIVEHIAKRGIAFSFTTNGTLLEPHHIEQLVALGAEAVTFSIDGDEELHDKLRGKGVFGKATESVRRLFACRKKLGSTRPIIGVNITMTGQVLGRVNETVSSIKKATLHCADFYRIHHQWSVTPEQLKAHQAEVQNILGCRADGSAAHLVPCSQIADPSALAAELVAVRQEAKVRMFPELAYHGIVNYYSANPRSVKRCLSPFFAALIKPDGSVTFCPDEWIDDYVLGNIRRENFAKIWNNRKARRFRNLLLRERHFAGCTRCSWMYMY